MNTDQSITSVRQTAINGLAVVGFIALVIAGIWLAIYSTRYVPSVVGRFGSAAVYLGSVFTPAERPTLSVVQNPTASMTISFGEASSTISTSVDSTPSAPKKPVATNWTPGTPVTVTNGTVSAPVAPNYSGRPDLAVAIESVGYITTFSGMAGDIVATTTIPAHTQIAVKFRVTNIGTNVSGPWTMNIAIPSGGTSASQTFSQDSLVPTQPSEYIAHFDNISPGTGYVITIHIDPNRQLTESNTANNSATSTSLTVLGN